MKTPITVPTFLVAFFAALIALPATTVVKVAARGLGFEHEQPWRAGSLLQRVALSVRGILRSALGALRALHRSPFGRPALALGGLALAAYVNPDALFAAPLVLGSVKTETQHTAEFLVSEANGTRSREAVTVTVPANTTFEAGFVLSALSANGKYTEYDNAGTDGTEEAAGVLYETLVNNSANPVDVAATVIVRDAEVKAAALKWKSGLNDVGKNAGLADLAGNGVIAR